MNWTDDRPLTHPKARVYVRRLVDCLKDNNFYIKRNRRIVFVCGARVNAAAPCYRDNFLAWAKGNIGNEARLLLAENAYGAATAHGSRFINIGDFEQLLAEIADCVLIFPESAGSFSEVGIFATKEPIRNKTLIARDTKYDVEDSFLLLGPFHTIGTHSLFHPGASFDSTTGPDPQLNGRIWGLICRRTNGFDAQKRPELKSFAEMNFSDRIAIISWVLEITARAKFADLLEIVRSVYGRNDQDVSVLKQTLNMLIALEMAKSPASELFCSATQEVDFQIVTKINLNKLRASFREFWNREFPAIWNY